MELNTLNKQNNQILIILIFLGQSPRQPSNEYRNQISRTVFGFGIYYKKNGIVEFLNIDLISCHPSSETGLEVIQNFRYINQMLKKKIEYKYFSLK